MLVVWNSPWPTYLIVLSTTGGVEVVWAGAMTISWAVNSQDAKKIEESTARTRDYLRQAQDALAAIATRWRLEGDDATQRDAAAAALKDYAEAADSVLEMAASDAATAFIFLLTAENAFGAVKQPPPAVALPKIGSYDKVDPEVLLAVAPDLFITLSTDGIGSDRARSLGIPVLEIRWSNADDRSTADVRDRIARFLRDRVPASA